VSEPPKVNNKETKKITTIYKTVENDYENEYEGDLDIELEAHSEQILDFKNSINFGDKGELKSIKENNYNNESNKYNNTFQTLVKRNSIFFLI